MFYFYDWKRYSHHLTQLNSDNLPRFPALSMKTKIHLQEVIQEKYPLPICKAYTSSEEKHFSLHPTHLDYYFVWSVHGFWDTRSASSERVHIPWSQKGNRQVFLLLLEGKKNAICSN